MVLELKMSSGQVALRKLDVDTFLYLGLYTFGLKTVHYEQNIRSSPKAAAPD